jgi:phosphomannomutase
MDLSIFKAYDVRGKYPEEINEEAAVSIGRAFARYLSAKQIVVGRDMRTSSPALSAKIIEGITAEGADVIDIGECTTPMMNFAVAAYDYDGGVMVTASHDPANYNGLKLVSKKQGQLDEEIGLPDLKKILTAGFGPEGAKGTVTKRPILEDYVGHLLKSAGNISDLKVVCDYGNGMGALSAKPTLARFDIELIEMYPDPDGEFPNHPANPHDVANFKELKARVLAEKADLGIFFDGDADRALFVDELGAIVPIDFLTVLLAQEELKDHPGENIYFDLRFSKSVAQEIRSAGGNPVMMKVGNPVYKRALREKGGILGAEFSGHMMFSDDYDIDDGLFTALKTLKLLTKKRSMSKLLATVKKFEGSDEESYEAGDPGTVQARLILAYPSAKLVELDGTYLDFPDGFISVRQSQTEPQLFRMRVEARTTDELEERLKKTREIIQDKA